MNLVVFLRNPPQYVFFTVCLLTKIIFVKILDLFLHFDCNFYPLQFVRNPPFSSIPVYPPSHTYFHLPTPLLFVYHLGSWIIGYWVSHHDRFLFRYHIEKFLKFWFQKHIFEGHLVIQEAELSKETLEMIVSLFNVLDCDNSGTLDQTDFAPFASMWLSYLYWSSKSSVFAVFNRHFPDPFNIFYVLCFRFLWISSFCLNAIFSWMEKTCFDGC